MTDQHRKNQQGAALVLSLLVVVCLSGVGLGLAAASSAERQIAANARGAVATSAAAEAAVEGVLTEISAAPDWSVWLAGVTSRFHDATRRPLTPSRVTVDLDQVTTELQAEAATAELCRSRSPLSKRTAQRPDARTARSRRPGKLTSLSC